MYQRYHSEDGNLSPKPIFQTKFRNSGWHFQKLSGALVGEDLVDDMVRGSLLYLGLNSGFIPHPRVVVLHTQGARGDVVE